MTTDDKIRDEKLRYDTNRQAPKISALSSGEIDIYEDEHKDIYKEIFDKVVSIRSNNRIKTDERDHNYLTHYFKGDAAAKKI